MKRAGVVEIERAESGHGRGCMLDATAKDDRDSKEWRRRREEADAELGALAEERMTACHLRFSMLWIVGRGD